MLRGRLNEVMKYKSFIVLVLVAWPLLLFADSKKEQQEQMQLIIQLLQMEEATKADVPAILLDDQAASKYCQDVIYHTEEQYSQDTARANAVIRDAQWISDHMLFPDEKLKEKLIKKKYDPEGLDKIYAWADWILHSVNPRYGILLAFCDKQLQLRREALQRTMPAGRLVSFFYREYGASRPETLFYELKRETTTERWLLNGHEVPETVVEEVRILAEQHEAYKCMRSYAEPPSFPQAPHLMGGPPSWEFNCKFEGGSIVSGSERMPLPESCYKIVNYLQKILKEI